MQDQVAEARATLENNIVLIDRAVASVSACYRLSAFEREELRSEVVVKLLSRSCRVLRRFRGESCLATYLTSVVRRVHFDRRAKEWGRWRNSAAALRRGRVAVQLEDLMVRDGIPFREAIEILRANFGLELTPVEFCEVAAVLPVRVRRRVVSEAALERLPSPSRADSRVSENLEAAKRKRACGLLRTLLNGVSSQDRTIVRLRFEKGWTVARIARQLQLDQRALYSRIHRLLAQLRRALEAAGFTKQDISDHCGQLGSDAQVELLHGEDGPMAPSTA